MTQEATIRELIELAIDLPMQFRGTGNRRALLTWLPQ
jgi:hypothetical protein